jgi:hypothetical protein
MFKQIVFQCNHASDQLFEARFNLWCWQWFWQRDRAAGFMLSSIHQVCNNISVP